MNVLKNAYFVPCGVRGDVGATGIHYIGLSTVQGGPKNVPTCFCQNFVKFSPNLIFLAHRRQ